MSIKEVLSGETGRRTLILRGSQGAAALASLYALGLGAAKVAEGLRIPTNTELISKFYPEGSKEHFLLSDFSHRGTKVRVYDGGADINPREFVRMFEFVSLASRSNLGVSLPYRGHTIPMFVTPRSQSYYLFFFGGKDSSRPSWIRGGYSDTVGGKIGYHQVTASFAQLTEFPEELVGEELARGLFDLRFPNGRPTQEFSRLCHDIVALSFGAIIGMKQDNLSYEDYKAKISDIDYFDTNTNRTYPAVGFDKSLYASIPSVTLTRP